MHLYFTRSSLLPSIQRYITDSTLALLGTALLTLLIGLFDLEARIPGCILLYYVVILLLAYLRGLYPALLSSIVSFFTFDFLFVPPLYSLRITKFEDILTLLVFLVSATITAQLATVVKRYRERVQREAIEAQVVQQTENARAALLSSVSHNLRTPLATIMTAATSLQDRPALLDEQTRDSMLTTILHETERMDSLVENLLDMSRIEAGVLTPEKNWYDINELIYAMLERMRVQLAERPLLLQLSPHNFPLELDAVQIDQVLTNLLENALAYTPAGSQLEIGTVQEERYVRVWIADAGPGIPVAAREEIFEKFYRLAPGKGERQHKGTGLGLAICRGLIAAHGGRIWVEPRAEGGACFCFTIPRSPEMREERESYYA